MPRTVDREMARSWIEESDTVGERIAPRFARSEVRERARDYLRGLLLATERKNSWQLAEVAGDATPYGLQHLPGRANRDADLVRDDLRGYVTEQPAEEGAILIVDETGFIKKGQKSVGVKRQYTATAGKTENCQVGVFLAYASRRAQAFIDREPYLPEEWARDEERRENKPEYRKRLGCAPSPNSPRRCSGGPWMRG
jgi:SRSO17 transposase